MTYGNRIFLTTAMAALLCGVPAGSALAADLGGGCCADLEERVAELEATTARKGNRVVSLQVSGQINKALLFWDDGVDSDVYVVDPDSDGSRFRFTGQAQISAGWTAGYTMEFSVFDAASNLVSQTNDEGTVDGLRVRRNFLYVESERLGRFSIGQENQATDGINEIDVVATYSSVSKTHYSGGFAIRDAGGGVLESGDLGGAGLTWANVLGAIGGGQEDIVRYDTPSIYGFIASASWGDDDVWDVALRFAKEFNSVRVAAGVGYLKDDRDDSGVDDQLSGSISAIHVPSGLFATFAAGSRSFDNGELDEATNIYAKVGISRRWFSPGATTLFVDWSQYENFGEGLDLEGAGFLESSEASAWGIGVVQSIDSAAMNLYAVAHFLDADLESSTDGDLEAEGYFAIVVGSHIKF
jgi:predicted porin